MDQFAALDESYKTDIEPDEKRLADVDSQIKDVIVELKNLV